MAGLALKEELHECNREILQLVQDRGGPPGRYAKERWKGIKNLVIELNSAPRVAAAAKLLPDLPHLPRLALDLSIVDSEGRPWDSSVKEPRDSAWRSIVYERPGLVVGSPMCTAFRTWQNLVVSRTGRDAELEEKRRFATEHMKFCCVVSPHQVRQGHLFLHAHPSSACSLELPCVQEVMGMDGVEVVKADQCQFGSVDAEGRPVKKPTTFLSSGKHILTALGKRCSGTVGRVHAVAATLCAVERPPGAPRSTHSTYVVPFSGASRRRWRQWGVGSQATVGRT